MGHLLLVTSLVPIQSCRNLVSSSEMGRRERIEKTVVLIWNSNRNRSWNQLTFLLFIFTLPHICFNTNVCVYFWKKLKLARRHTLSSIQMWAIITFPFKKSTNLPSAVNGNGIAQNEIRRLIKGQVDDVSWWSQDRTGFYKKKKKRRTFNLIIRKREEKKLILFSFFFKKHIRKQSYNI